MKKYFLLFAALLMGISAMAQGYNYYEWGWGADVSYIRGFTNIPKQAYHPSANFNYIYNYNPYLPIEAELQVGTLSGGGLKPGEDIYGRKYINNYIAFIIHADFQLGAVMDYGDSGFLNIIKNFYAGTGIGLVNNSNKVQRYSIYAPPYPEPGYYKFPGTDKSINLMVPLRFGYEFRFFDAYDEPSVAIDIGYIHNVAFGEGLDGYNDPPKKFKNNALDQYGQLAIGFKYYFGNTVSFNKLVRPYR